MTSLTFLQISELIMDQAKVKGFGTNPSEIIVSEKIALIHSEISEAYEAYRQKNIEGKDGFREELADAVTRILHLAAVEGIDIEAEILKKLDYNKSRVWHWDELNEKNTKI